jgi:hypothetical protein
MLMTGDLFGDTDTAGTAEAAVAEAGNEAAETEDRGELLVPGVDGKCGNFREG